MSEHNNKNRETKNRLLIWETKSKEKKEKNSIISGQNTFCKYTIIILKNREKKVRLLVWGQKNEENKNPEKHLPDDHRSRVRVYILKK